MTNSNFIIMNQLTTCNLIEFITGDIVHLCRASMATLCGQTRGWSVHRRSVRALQQEVSQWCPRQSALQTESWTKGRIYFCAFWFFLLLLYYFYFPSYFSVQSITSVCDYNLLFLLFFLIQLSTVTFCSIWAVKLLTF